MVQDDVGVVGMDDIVKGSFSSSVGRRPNTRSDDGVM